MASVGRGIRLPRLYVGPARRHPAVAASREHADNSHQIAAPHRGQPMAWKKLFPELELIDDPKERDRVVSRCHRAMLRSGRYWCSFLGLMFVALPAACVLIQLLLDWIGMPRGVTKAIISGLVGVALLSGLHLFWLGPVQRGLRRELRDRGLRICMECGRDLRRQVEPRCPECGTSFDPKPHPKP